MALDANRSSPGTWEMRAIHNLGTVSVPCDEANLVSDASLLPAAVPTLKVGLAGLVEHRVRLGRHGANGGAKALTVIGSMLVGGDSIADTALPQAGATGERFDRLRAPADDRLVAARIQMVQRARARRGDRRAAGPVVGRRRRTC